MAEWSNPLALLLVWMREGIGGREAWLKPLFLRTRHEEGLIYKELKGEWFLAI